MSTELPAPEILRDRINDLQVRIYQVGGLCDVLASAADPAVEGRLLMEPLSVQNAAIVARDTLKRLADEIEGVLDVELTPKEKRQLAEAQS